MIDIGICSAAARSSKDHAIDHRHRNRCVFGYRGSVGIGHRRIVDGSDVDRQCVRGRAERGTIADLVTNGRVVGTTRILRA